MSTKTKASSKNKKAAPKKAVKKTAQPAVAKKPAAKKKVVKPIAKKTSQPVKKTATKAKPAAAKKVLKKSTPVKKQVKPAAKKTAKPVKKVAAKKVVKKVVKKAAPKKIIKATKAPVKKVIAKKVSKPVKITPAPAKKIVKPVEVKKAASTPAKTAKPSRPVVTAEVEKPAVKVQPAKPQKPAAKEKAPVAKKSIVAPITFRQEDTGPAKFIKEPHGKFEMEFVIRASEDMVFEFVSTESGLSEWFCDDVTIRNGIFTFTWEGQQQQAKLVKEIPPAFIRYQWMDKNDGSYFEFKTQKDELTNDISLIITDFAMDKSDEDSARLLWHSQVDKLLHVLGSFF